jgi:hypothetical protein
VSNINKHGRDDGFTDRDVEDAVRNMTPDQAQRFRDLNRLNKAEHIVSRIREPIIRKELINGVWRDTAGPMLLLRGLYRTDGTHEPLTLTENYQWQAQRLQPKAPFPYKPHPHSTGPHPEWDYVDWVMSFLLEDLKDSATAGQDHKPQTYIPKTRELLTSWTVCGFIFWHCEFHESVGWIGQSEKDEKAQGLVKYENILYENQPDYLKARFPLLRNRNTGTAHRINWRHGSWFRAVPQGERQLASDHPHGYFSDESAHQPAWLATIGVALPAVRQVVCVSSAAFSDFGHSCDPSHAA